MKKITLMLAFLCLTSNLFAYRADKDYGPLFDGYKVLVSSKGINSPYDDSGVFSSTGAIVSMSIADQANNSSIRIFNAGDFDIWLDNVADVQTSGQSEGFLLENGQSIYIDGRVSDDIFGRIKAALTDFSTVYISITGND